MSSRKSNIWLHASLIYREWLPGIFLARCASVPTSVAPRTTWFPMVLGFELRSPVPVTQGTFGFSIRLFVTFLSSGPQERRPPQSSRFSTNPICSMTCQMCSPAVAPVNELFGTHVRLARTTAFFPTIVISRTNDRGEFN